MKKAGGIIALIAGVFGTGAAIVTLFIGGVGAAVEAEDAGTIIGLGWGGLFFAFLTIILGAVAMNTESTKPGIALIISSLAGAILGGTLVAICLSLSLVGGILALIGVKQEQNSVPVTTPKAEG